MTDTIRSLGPLVRLEDRWALGDTRRPGGGAWVEFREDGLCAHARDSGEEFIPWTRIMLGFRLVVGAKYPSKGENVTQFGMLAGLPGPFRGRGGGYLHMTLRHPYEDHMVFFDRHPHWYPLPDVYFLDALLKEMVTRGEIHRLADTAWLDGAVTRVPPLKKMMTKRRTQEALTQVLGNSGVADPSLPDGGHE
ncbi:hypothetical protein [Streptomyces sp. NPDC002676]